MYPINVRTVLATTDLEDSSLVALGVACRLGAVAGASVHVLHVPSRVVGSAEPRASDGAEDRLRALLRRAGAHDDVRVHIIPGVAAQTIRTLADHLGADVIVVGAHRETSAEGTRRRLGSTALAVADGSRAPTLVVSSEDLALPLQRILVPVDGSETARGALHVGLSWASALRARASGSAVGGGTCLTGLYVDDSAGRGGVTPAWDAASLERELDATRQKAGSWAGIAIDGVVVPAPDAGAAIVEYATGQDFDLVVLGTRGRGDDAGAGLGSVSATVVASLSVPVLLVSPSVWASQLDAA